MEKIFFTCLDEDVLSGVINYNESASNQNNFVTSRLIKELVDEKQVVPDTYTSARLVSIDGQITSVPLLLLSLCDSFTSFVSDVSIYDLSDISISVPGSSTLVNCLKDLLLCGQTTALTTRQIREVQSFLKDIGLRWNLETMIASNEFGVGDFEGVDDSVKEESDSNSSEEDIFRHDFWIHTLNCEQPIEHRSLSVCPKSCLSGCDIVLSSWSEDELDAVKTIFSGQTKFATKNKLLAHLVAQSNLGIETDGYVVKSHKFCIRFLHHITGISEYVLKVVLKDFWRGVRGYQHGNREIFKQPSVATITFIGWFKQFLLLYGQSSPDEQLMILPHWLKGKALYKIYVKEVAKPRVALRTFYKHMDRYFGPQRIDHSLPRVRVSKYSSHSVCDTCDALNTKRNECSSEVELSMVRSLINQHQLDFSSARHAVEQIKQSALVFAGDNLYIQLDGMDNQKSYCPRYRNNTKELAGTERLPTKIYGGIIWSGYYEEKRKVIFFLNHDHFENGSDMVVSTLYYLLKEALEDLGRLPRKLHLNLDNCFRENKNKYLFSWLANLVELNVFSEVSINFLMKGHTGNEVDQLFSILADEFKTEILTVDSLKDIILNAPINPTPDCRHLWYTFGWRDYVKDHMTDIPLKNHSKFNSFLIRLDGGIAKLRGKRLPQSSDHDLTPRAGIRVLKAGHANNPVGAAEFRVEKLDFDKINRGLNIFLSKLSLEKRMSIQTSWDTLRDKLEGLPRVSENLTKMVITDFPQQQDEDVVMPVDLSQPEVTHELRGELCPEDAVEGLNIDQDASVGMDVCVYTEEVRGRPWVGRIVEILPQRRFKLQWFGRKTSRSKLFKALKNPDGSPWIAELEYDMVMFWIISEPASRTEESFSVSTFWLKLIENEYNEMDKK